jgi:hypothetical protein
LIEIIKITADEWNEISEETMEYAFDESCWGPQMNRVSYAILAQDDKSKVPYGFATIVELDAQTGYIQHGGTFPSSNGRSGFFKNHRTLEAPILSCSNESEKHEYRNAQIMPKGGLCNERYSNG